MQKIHKHLLQVLGGYRKRLKRKNPLKGFTLVELITVIVILAILAAILIPGLLKWIDQAKDKKYELEAREISQAAEAALTKMYAQGAGVSVIGDKLVVSGEQDLAKVPAFQDELAKFTDAAVTGIEISGADTDGTGSWVGSANDFKITFTSDGVPITAELSPDTDNRWKITPSDGTGGEPDDELNAFDDHPDLHVREANAVAKAAKKALAKVNADDSVYVSEVYWGGLYFGGTPGVDYSGNQDFMKMDAFVEELRKLTNVEVIKAIFPYGKGWDGDNGTDGIHFKTWDGSVSGFEIEFESSDGSNIRAYYLSGPEIINDGHRHIPTDGWEITTNPSYWPY